MLCSARPTIVDHSMAWLHGPRLAWLIRGVGHLAEVAHINCSMVVVVCIAKHAQPAMLIVTKHMSVRVIGMQADMSRLAQLITPGFTSARQVGVWHQHGLQQ